MHYLIHWNIKFPTFRKGILTNKIILISILNNNSSNYIKQADAYLKTKTTEQGHFRMDPFWCIHNFNSVIPESGLCLNLKDLKVWNLYRLKSNL